MFINSRLGLFLLVPLLCTLLISARQNHSVARPGDRIWQWYYSQPWPAERLAAESERLDGAEDDVVSRKPSTENATPRYVALPMAALVGRIPELKTLQPAPDQQEPPTILQNMGRSMDNFARNIAVDGLSVKIAESKFSPPPFLSRLRASKLTGQQALLDTVDPLLPLPSRGYAQAGVLEEFPDSRLWSASRNYN
jgi:hypothetical protein